VLLLSAHDLTERRKGADIMPALWQHLPRRPLTLLLMGHGQAPAAVPGLHVHTLGWVGDEATRMLAYNAADALLHPAPVDNFPNVVLESLACGTPVVALPVGGVPEMVRPGVSGWLADAPTAKALATTVTRALDEQDQSWRTRCRELVEYEYLLSLQAERYHHLFSQLSRH
jgi:glycosyltransferase involved in cell wall biosynthesis